MNTSSLKQISAAADAILKRYGKKYTPAVSNHVAHVLASELRARSTLIVYPDDEGPIKRRLIFDDNILSDKSQAHLHFYNILIGDLDSRGIVKGKQFDIPRKITRELILTRENNLDDHIRHVQMLHDDLLEFRKLPADIREAEIDCVCTVLASAAIFAKITFHDFHNWILSIDFCDFHFNPDYINCRTPNSNAFYRFFLPYPANMYFMRCVRFYIKNHIKLKRIKPRWQDDKVFQTTFIDRDTVSGLFNEWLSKRICARGGTLINGFTVPSFCEAVRAASMIDISPAHEKWNRIPPFIISIQAGLIPCYSYENSRFRDYIGNDFTIPDSDVRRRLKIRRQKPEYWSNFKLIFREICDLRRSLLTQVDSIPLRRETMDKIAEITLKKGPSLSKEDAHNLNLYTRWLKYRLLVKNEHARNAYLAVKSFNDQAPMVESLILNASGSGTIESISQSDIEDIILYYVYPEYSVHNVKDVLIGFTNFIKTETPSYRGPNWSSSKMNKENVPHLKVFITPLMLQKTIELFEEKFTKHLNTTYKHQEVKQRLRPRAVHKARVLGMMTELAFYTGMRIHEIALLQLKNVRYAGGVVISILKTKTDAGERDIPLSLLAPRSFVDRFMDFWQARRKEVSLESLLFVQIDGRHWDTSHTSKEIASVFNTYMVQGMVFHNLRDAFASHLMLRWFAAFHRDLLPNDARFLSQELFDDENLGNFRKLVLGNGVHRKFQDNFTHMQAVLAKLLGHIGPMTSFESYVHVVDLLFFFFTRSNTPEYMNLSCEVAEDLLQITYPSLPPSLKGRGIKRIKTDIFLQYQRDLIDLPKPARPVPRKPKN